MHLRLFLLMLLLPLAAWGKESPGVRLYERGEYQRAVRALTSEVKSRLRSPKDRALARVYLAASLHALGKTEEARQQLEVLARDYPAQRVDPALFPPELVALEEEVRTDPVQLAERERLAAEEARRQQEAEAAAAELRRQQEAAEARRRQEEEEARRQQGQVEAPVAPVVEAPSRWRLRPEATGFADVPGKTWGLGAGLTFGQGALEGSARAVFGTDMTYELEGGLVLGDGFFQPRLAVRGSAIPSLNIFGAGAMVGARLHLSPRLVALADVGAVYFLPPSKKVGNQQFTEFGVLASVGLGFNLLSQ